MAGAVHSPTKNSINSSPRWCQDLSHLVRRRPEDCHRIAVPADRMTLMSKVVVPTLAALVIAGGCASPSDGPAAASTPTAASPSSDALAKRYRIPDGFCGSLDYSLLVPQLGKHGDATQGYTGVGTNFESTDGLKCSQDYQAGSASQSEAFLEVAVFTYESTVGSQLAYDTWPKIRDGLTDGSLSAKVDQMHFVVHDDSYSVFIRDSNLFVYVTVLLIGGAARPPIDALRSPVNAFASHVVDRLPTSA